MKKLQNTFGYLTAPKSVSPSAIWVDSKIALETVLCSLHAEHQRQGKRLSPLTISFEDSSLSSRDDVVWTWQSDCLLTERAVGLLRKAKLTGYDLKPVDIQVTANQFSDLPEKLWELVVVGWGGIAMKDSGVRLIQHCPTCRLLVYSCFDKPQNLIKKTSWDGSDFFIVWPLPRFIFLSPRATEFFRKLRFSGSYVQPIESRVYACYDSRWLPVSTP